MHSVLKSKFRKKLDLEHFYSKPTPAMYILTEG